MHQLRLVMLVLQEVALLGDQTELLLQLEDQLVFFLRFFLDKLELSDLMLQLSHLLEKTLLAQFPRV